MRKCIELLIQSIMLLVNLYYQKLKILEEKVINIREN